MKLKKTLCAALITASLSPLMASAESKEGILNFTVGYGYNYFAAKRNLDNTGMGLLGLGYNFTNKLGIEAMLGIYNTKSTSIDGDGRSVHGKLFMLDGVFHFWPSKRFEPYFMLGLGVLGLSYNNTDPNNEANVNGGVGIQYFFSQQASFRFEGRDIYTINGGKNDAMLAGGINFLFDAG